MNSGIARFGLLPPCAGRLRPCPPRSPGGRGMAGGGVQVPAGLAHSSCRPWCAAGRGRSGPGGSDRPRPRPRPVPARVTRSWRPDPESLRPAFRIRPSLINGTAAAVRATVSLGPSGLDPAQLWRPYSALRGRAAAQLAHFWGVEQLRLLGLQQPDSNPASQAAEHPKFKAASVSRPRASAALRSFCAARSRSILKYCFAQHSYEH